MLEQKLAELAERIGRFTRRDGMHATSIGSLYFYRASAPSEPFRHVYQSALALIAQGPSASCWPRKSTTMARPTF
jgi:hypothetical protein